ncbi:MAG: hypothetical protein ACOCTN_05585 [Candidatus Natronoplasma sp.]
MLEKNGIKRKMAIFATFAVVLLIGMAFIPAAEGKPGEEEPLPEPKPGEADLPQREQMMEAAQEIELKDGRLHLPEEEAKRIRMSEEELDVFNQVLKEINMLVEKGYLDFEQKENTIEIEETEKTQQMRAQPMMPIGGGGSGGSSGKTEWVTSDSWIPPGLEHEVYLNHDHTQMLANEYVSGGTSAAVGFLVGLIGGLPGAVAGAIVGFVVGVGMTHIAEHVDEGSGVVFEGFQAPGALPTFYSVDPQ